MKKEKKVHFSHHSIERMKASGITISQALELFHNATKEKPTKGIATKKAEKWGEMQQNIVYFRNGSIVFVCKHLFPDPSYVCYTMYDQRLNR